MAFSVYYVARGLALNLTEPDLGHPALPGLWDEVYPSRKLAPNQLQCLQCLDDRGPDCPEFMYLQDRDGLRVAVHHNTNVRDHPAVESDAHRALKERTAATAGRAGFRVDVEDRAAHGKRRTDVLIHGHEGVKLGVEAQLAFIGDGSVRSRTAIAEADGITPMWVVNTVRSGPINLAPWCRVPNAPWRTYLSDVALMAQSGVRQLEWLACTTLVGRGQACPDRKRRLPCDGRHPNWVAVQVRYDDLIARAAAREYVPVTMRVSRGVNHFWVPASHFADFATDEAESAERRKPADTGGQVEPKPLSVVCTYGVDTGVRAAPRGPRDDGAWDDAPVSGICCGEHATAHKGKPLVLACKLCPASPTYWRAA